MNPQSFQFAAIIQTKLVPSTLLLMVLSMVLVPCASAKPQRKGDSYNDLTYIKIMFGYKDYSHDTSVGYGGIKWVNVSGREGAKCISVWAGQTIRLKAILGANLEMAIANDLSQHKYQPYGSYPLPQWYADPAGDPVADWRVAPDMSSAKKIYLTDPVATYPDGSYVNLNGTGENNDIHWYWLKNGSNLEAKYTVVTTIHGIKVVKIGAARFYTFRPSYSFNPQYGGFYGWWDTITTYDMGLGHNEISVYGITYNATVGGGTVTAPCATTAPKGVADFCQILVTDDNTNHEAGNRLSNLTPPILDNQFPYASEHDAPTTYNLVGSTFNDKVFEAYTYLMWHYQDGIWVSLAQLDWSFDVITPVLPGVGIPGHSVSVTGVLTGPTTNHGVKDWQIQPVWNSVLVNTKS